MVDGKDRDSVVELVGFAMSCGDLHIGEEVTKSVTPQRDDDFWFDESDLQLEPGHALFLFFIRRIPIVGWTVFDDIADVYLVAFEADRCEELIEELSRRSDEWPPKLIFFLSRGLPDKHDGCMGISFSEDRICIFMKRAPFPLFQLFL